MDPKNINFVISTFGNDEIEYLTQYLDISTYVSTNEGVMLGEKPHYDYIKFTDCSEIDPESYHKGIAYCAVNKTFDLVFNSTFQSYFTINFSKCSNATVSGKFCKSKEEIDDFIKKRTVSLYLYYWDLDPYNYIKPLKEDINTYNIEISEEFSNYYYFSFDVLNVYTDDGVVFPNSKVASNLGFNNLKTGKFRKSPNDDQLATINLSLSQREKIFERHYKKLQDVIAQVGGFFSFLEFIGNLIVGLVNPIVMKLSFINHFFNFTKLNKSDEKNPCSSTKLKHNQDAIFNVKELSVELNYVKDSGEIKRKESNTVDSLNDFYKDYLVFRKIKKSKAKLKMTTAEILQTALCSYFFAGRSIRNRKMCIAKLINSSIKKLTYCRSSKTQEI
jgi:hypothetical protein